MMRRVLHYVRDLRVRVADWVRSEITPTEWFMACGLGLLYVGVSEGVGPWLARTIVGALLVGLAWPRPRSAGTPRRPVR